MTTAKMVEVVLRALLKKICGKMADLKRKFKGKSVEKDSNKHINKEM